MTRYIVVPLAFAIASAAQTADPAYRRMLESKEQVTAHLVREARSITDRAGQEILSVATWEKQKARRIEEMRDMLGLLPWPQRTPLNARITGKLDEEGYTIAGARQHLRDEVKGDKKQVALPFMTGSHADLRQIRQGLQEILTILAPRH